MPPWLSLCGFFFTSDSISERAGAFEQPDILGYGRVHGRDLALGYDGQYFECTSILEYFMQAITQG